MPKYPLQVRKPLGRLTDGQKTSIPLNSILTALQLGKDDQGTHWLDPYYQTLTLPDDVNVELGEEQQLPPITAPANNGGSSIIHLPDVAKPIVVSTIAFGGETLTVFYRQVLFPKDLAFGPEAVARIWTKEARTEGGGALAMAENCMLSGFQLHKDPDQTLSLEVWYRPVL